MRRSWTPSCLLLMSLGQTVFVFWFPFLESTSALYALAILFGFAYSGVMSCILVFTRMMVSPGFAGRAMSFHGRSSDGEGWGWGIHRGPTV
ncbi:MAG: hypothetical protein CM1200mP9_11120 [Gammaproteobacteria bacterium]|nr:MAG: hypothetical protein CM1200mP9_11120 [Gammaproteobacteria bacterium]